MSVLGTRKSAACLEGELRFSVDKEALAGEGHGGVVQVDHQITGVVTYVAEGVFDLGFGTGFGVGEKVVAHRDGAVVADDDSGILESYGRPGLKRESFVFVYATGDKVRKSFVFGRTKLLLCSFGGLEENFAHAVCVQAVDVAGRTRFVVFVLAKGGSDRDDPVAPGFLSGNDFFFGDGLGHLASLVVLKI